MIRVSASALVPHIAPPRRAPSNNRLYSWSTRKQLRGLARRTLKPGVEPRRRGLETGRGLWGRSQR